MPSAHFGITTVMNTVRALLAFAFSARAVISSSMRSP
jgi:hypothetical protein